VEGLGPGPPGSPLHPALIIVAVGATAPGQ